ncbi:hypothetical protein [Nocardia abscessus]|nr:hypothetical protein [Nocardia abscessus]
MRSSSVSRRDLFAYAAAAAVVGVTAAAAPATPRPARGTQID